MTLAASKKPKMVAARRAQGYEADPPHCANCDHFAKQTTRRDGWRSYTTPARCGIAGFPVSGNGICDLWVQDGNGLEPSVNAAV